MTNDSNISNALEALIVRKIKNKYQGKVKCFNCGQHEHLSTKCPYVDQNEDDEKIEKSYKKKPWNHKKIFNFFKKKSL